MNIEWQGGTQGAILWAWIKKHYGGLHGNNDDFSQDMSNRSDDILWHLVIDENYLYGWTRIDAYPTLTFKQWQSRYLKNSMKDRIKELLKDSK